jgi:hypothetical protein
MSSGCGKAPGIPSSMYNNGSTISITAANMQRRYILNVPTNYDNKKPYKLIITVAPPRWKRQADLRLAVLRAAAARQQQRDLRRAQRAKERRALHINRVGGLELWLAQLERF